MTPQDVVKGNTLCTVNKVEEIEGYNALET